MPKHAEFRFYEELNDFLPAGKRKTAFVRAFDGTPSVKDTVEAIGVPHTEIDLILVNGVSVGFDHRLADGDRIAVYPVFESLDIADVTRLRASPLRVTAFMLDVHLGKLAKILRLLGFDSRYDNDPALDDADIIRAALAEKRIILTRDIGLLKNGVVTHGYWLRSTNPQEQAREVIRRFDLADTANPFTRCTVCNGVVAVVPKEGIEDRLEPDTRRYFNEFFMCGSCGRVYWKGSHYERMKAMVDGLLGR